jgi:hypothetical protein
MFINIKIYPSFTEADEGLTLLYNNLEQEENQWLKK